LTFRRALSSGAYTLAGTGADLVIAFVFAGLLIRFVGPERSGFVFSIYALLAVGHVLGGFGVGNGVTRRVAGLIGEKRFPEARVVSGMLLTANGGIAALVAGVVFAATPAVVEWTRISSAYAEDATVATRLIAVSFVVDQIGASLRSLYAAMMRQDVKTLSSAYGGISTNLLKIAALSFSPTLRSASLAGAIGGVIWLTVDWIVINRLLKGPVWPNWDRGEFLRMSKFTFWDMTNAAGGMMSTVFDRLLVTNAAGSSALPYYTVAQRFFAQTHSAISMQFSFIFPLLATEGEHADRRVKEVEERLRWLIGCVATLAYLALFLCAGTVLDVLVGREFSVAAAPYILLSCIQGFFHAQAIASFYLLYAVGNSKYNALLNLGNGVSVIAICAALTPRYGAVGAAIAQMAIIPVAAVFVLRSRRLICGVDDGARFLLAQAPPALAFGAAIAFAYWSRPLAANPVGALARAVASLLIALAIIIGWERVEGRTSRLAIIQRAIVELSARFKRRLAR